MFGTPFQRARKVIIQQGDPGTTFYILFEGEVRILAKGI